MEGLGCRSNQGSSWGVGRSRNRVIPLVGVEHFDKSLPNCNLLSAIAMSESRTLLVAQVTDTHLFATADECLLGVNTADSCQTVLDWIRGLERQPDLLLLTGDLSQDGSAASYERLQGLLAPLGIPAYWLPGNHDRPAVMAQVFHQPPISAQKSIFCQGWQLLLLDSSVPDKVHGVLTPETLDWLDRELQHTQAHSVAIALHHPPFPVGATWMNDIGLHNTAGLLAICDRYPQVKLVLFGHIHQPFHHTHNHVHYLGSPSTCIQFKPDSPTFALDPVAPGFRLLELHPDGTWQTQIERIAYSCTLDLAAAGY